MQTPYDRDFQVKTMVFTVFDHEIVSNRELFSERLESHTKCSTWRIIYALFCGSKRCLEWLSALKLFLAVNPQVTMAQKPLQ